jgi:propanediol utilization protein
MATLTTPYSKRADETVTVSCFFVSELAPGETVTSSSATTLSGAVTTSGAAASSNGLAASVRVAGGADGTPGVILLTANTSAGQVLKRDIEIPIVGG